MIKTKSLKPLIRFALFVFECMLREKGMLNKVSPMDLMDEYAKVYKVEYGDKELMSEVPKKVRELDEKLELNLFPK